MAEAVRVEQRLGLPSGYVSDLRLADDWSLVIRVHALLEAALAQLIASELGRPSLASFLEDMPMHGDQGRVKLASLLGLLTQVETRFLIALSRLRNRFAHDPRSIAQGIADYCAQLDKNQRKTFLRDVSGSLPRAHEFVADGAAGLLVWASACHCLGKFMCTHDLHDSRDRLRELEKESARVLSTADFIIRRAAPSEKPPSGDSAT